ncbi:MAG: tRNA (adenosine(37)-N6)-threonylcarbamoyltransferase complex ATPase subunit type 1 TsaE [Eubacteriales bacterium]|jgi:tRNA threonylcarbamoyladenosine biosynthesis protein TsaE|nr:tRNA (adenosine(37)-N6)-threonylcarbamoyltransferase complex ATPase subunit type 1 TsaE [Clostridiales bacterium]
MKIDAIDITKENIKKSTCSCPARFVTHCERETEAVGAALAQVIIEDEELNRSKLQNENREYPFIALYGGMGAGKTVFVRGFASLFSPGAAVRSPTYTVANEYKTGKYNLYHFDLYRITDADDLYSTGYFEYIDSGVCIAEWSENAHGCLPRHIWRVDIEHGTDENERILTICRAKTEGGV